MSDFNNNLDNKDFLEKLELLRDLEFEKPVEEMDVSLVMACVELILELRGETVNFTPEEVEEKVRKIPFVEETTSLNTPPQSVKSRSTKAKSRKILLIAAIISILIAIFAVTSIAFEWNIFDELKNRFGTVFSVPVNEEIDIGGITIVYNGESEKYKNIEDALKNNSLDFLFPSNLPENITLRKIIFYQLDSKKEVILGFNSDNLSYSITFNQLIPEQILSGATGTIEINGLNCYVIDKKDISIYQIYFVYNQNLYMVSYNNKQDLIKIIENLMELQ